MTSRSIIIDVVKSNYVKQLLDGLNNVSRFQEVNICVTKRIKLELLFISLIQTYKQNIFFFLIEFNPWKTVKQLGYTGLLRVEELETETLVQS